jgi:Uma2 family endonuclease
MGDPALGRDESFTYRHYRTWPDEERWELVEGQAWSMSPSPSTWHQELAARLFTELRAFLKGKPCKAFIAPFDVLLPIGDEPDDEVASVVQPDIVVICDPAKITARGARGAPDLAIEILSPRTARKDLGVKYRLYESRGVREYWVVDPDARVIHAWTLEGSAGFGEERISEAGQSAGSAVLEGFAVEAGELFAPME